MRSVIEVLPPEIPDIELTRTSRNWRLPHDDPVRRVSLRFEWKVAKAVADLGLSDPAGPEDHQLDVAERFRVLASAAELFSRDCHLIGGLTTPYPRI